MTAAAEPAAWRSFLARVPLHSVGVGLMYLVLPAAFTGAAFWNIAVGPIHIFLYRVLLVALWLFLPLAALYTRTPVFAGHLHRVRLSLLFLALWVAYAILNAGFVRDPAEYLVHIGFLAMGASLIFFTAYFLDDLPRLGVAFRLWAVVLALLIALGLAQQVIGFQLSIAQFADAEGQDRFTPMGTFPRVNQYASFLGLSAGLLFALMTGSRGRWRLALAGIGLIAVIQLLYITGARANLLALGIEAIVALGLVTTVGVRTRAFGLAVLGILTLFSFAPQTLFQGPGELVERLGRYYEKIQSGRGSLGVRYHLALNGGLCLRDSAGLGVGAGQFNAYMGSPGYHATAMYPSGSGAARREITYPHNWWIELLAEYGVAIFAGFVVFFVALFGRVVRLYQRAADAVDRYLGRVLILTLAGYPVVALGPGHFAAFRPQWVLLALAVAYVAAPRQRWQPANAASIRATQSAHS